MAVRTHRDQTLTLEEFLRDPRIDRKPYLEYIDGKVVRKMSPQPTHGLLQLDFGTFFNGFARQRGLGRAFTELRFTFAGRSILPDVAFLLKEHIVVRDDGRIVDLVPFPPDIHLEVMSPDKRLRRNREKLSYSTTNGCPLGVLVHPYREWIEVYRGGIARMLPTDGEIDFAPVLPGLRLAVSEVFGWLKNPV